MTATPRLASEERPVIEVLKPSSSDHEGREDQFKSVKSIFSKLLKRSQVNRKIDCFHCKNVYEVSRSAQSTQCPKCGGYISLENYEVRTDWRRSIQTRGDVTIHKGGSVMGVKVQCHNLTVLGSLSASVHCSGILKIISNVKIIGAVTCEQLFVDKGAVVEFQGPVMTQKAFLNGDVKAHITCYGTLVLEKKSQLIGAVRAKSFLVREGAKHKGNMTILQDSSAS